MPPASNSYLLLISVVGPLGLLLRALVLLALGASRALSVSYVGFVGLEVGKVNVS